jgi:gamma-glutamyl:cysteine ligase YbdK (ATP-grasp superfamily)
MNSVATAQPSARLSRLRAFEGCGIELEYALVRRDTLDVAPIADEALRVLSGATTPPCDVARGMFGWSNELTLHVLELKNADPTIPVDLLASRFHYEVREMNAALADLGARLMPAGMHPWMDPRCETRLWPHANAEIYRAYDRIFDCSTHGYANLQSMHVNLPFDGDEEFARLHDAVRMVIPILPALAASSPYVEGNRASALDYRLEVYRTNAQRVPQVTGAVVPERCCGTKDYEREVLQPMYDAIAEHDPDGVLQYEWLNARGAIARFDRGAIEIRVLDTQECPRMDIGLAALVLDLVQAVSERRLPAANAAALPTPCLADILHACVRDAENARIQHCDYLAAFGMRSGSCSAAGLWEAIAERLEAMHAPRIGLWRGPLAHILGRGTLARRLLAIAGRKPSRARLHRAYAAVCDALEAGTPLD